MSCTAEDSVFVFTLKPQVTGKRVSVWSTDKRGPEMERMGPASKERYFEVLKAEVSCVIGAKRAPALSNNAS